jgi:hypothetical protein
MRQSSRCEQAEMDIAEIRVTLLEIKTRNEKVR